MTQYDSVNVKLSNSQLFLIQNCESSTKNETEVILKLSLNMIGNGANCPYKLLLTEQQVPNLRKDFANNLSAGIRL